MTQESYKLDLDIEYDQKALEQEVTVNARYKNVTMNQVVEILDRLRGQGCIIKSFEWV